MQLPSWLAGLTGANKFANNPTNGFQANLGDMAQAAGHSMLQHYRGNGGEYGGNPLIAGLNAGPGMSTPMPERTVDKIAPLAPRGASINGGSLPPAVNAMTPPELAAPSMPQAGLGGTVSTPWGQIPTSLLLSMGLR